MHTEEEGKRGFSSWKHKKMDLLKTVGRGERAFHDKDGEDHLVFSENCVPKHGVHIMAGKTWPQERVSKSVVNKKIHVLALFLVEIEPIQKWQERHLSSHVIYVVDFVQLEPAFLYLSQGGNKAAALP